MTGHYLAQDLPHFVYETSPIFIGVPPWRIVAPCPRPLALQEGCGKNDLEYLCYSQLLKEVSNDKDLSYGDNLQTGS